MPNTRCAAWGWVRWSALACTLLLFVVSIGRYPSEALAGNVDHAWAIVLQTAVLQGLKIGCDLVFSYGPFGWAWTLEIVRLPDFPFGLVVLGCLLRLVWMLLVVFCADSNLSWRGVVVAVFLFACGQLPYGTDAAVLFGFFVLFRRIVDTESHFGAIGCMIAGGMLLFLGLSKFSWFVAAGFTGTLAIAALLLQRRFTTIISLAGGALAVCVITIIAGQASATSLLGYFVHGLEISHGFSENMGLDGGSNAFMPLSLAILAGGWVFLNELHTRHRFDKLMRSTAFVGLMLLSLKMSLTRADAVHLQTTPLFLLGCLIATKTQQSRWQDIVTVVLGVVIAVSLYVLLASPVEGVPANADLYSQRVASATFTSDEARSLETSSFDVLGNLQASLPLLPGRYQPRPVFQSYVAFTPKLAEINTEYFLRAPPDAMFMTRFPIDQRLWAMEDSPIFAEVLRSWEPVRQVGQFLWLRAPHTKPLLPNALKVSSHFGEFGKWQWLPSSNGILWIRFPDLPRTSKRFPLVSGERAYVLAYRLSDGSEHVSRLPPGVARTGFVISPSIQTFRDFAIFRQTSTPMTECIAFAIAPDDPRSAEGTFRYELSNERVERPSRYMHGSFLPIESYSGTAELHMNWINGVEYVGIPAGSYVVLFSGPRLVKSFRAVIESAGKASSNAVIVVSSAEGKNRVLWNSSEGAIVNQKDLALRQGESLVLHAGPYQEALVRDVQFEIQ